MALTQLYTPAFADVDSDDAPGSQSPPEVSSVSGICDATLRKRKRSFEAAPTKLRSLRIDLSPLSGATGSSHVQMGRTIVTAGIFGPAPLSTAGSAAMDSVDAMERARVVVDVQYAPGSVPLGDLAASEARVGAPPAPGGSYKSSGGGRAQMSCLAGDPELEELLGSTLRAVILLEALPKCAIHVQLLVMQACGSEFSAAVCASVLALVDAGMPMKGLVASCAVASFPSSIAPDETRTTLVLDPTRDEELESRGTLSIAILDADRQNGHDRNKTDINDVEESQALKERQVVQLKQAGRLTTDEMSEGLQLAQRGCDAILTAMKAALSNLIEPSECRDSQPAYHKDKSDRKGEATSVCSM